jgi:N-acetylmuramoyl-L-alanine amidase
LFFCAGFNILSIFVTFRISKFNNFVTNGLKHHCIPTIIDGEPIMMEEMWDSSPLSTKLSKRKVYMMFRIYSEKLIRYIRALMLTTLVLLGLKLAVHIGSDAEGYVAGWKNRPFYSTAVEVYEGQKLAGASLMKSMELQRALQEAQREAVQSAQEEIRSVNEERERAAAIAEAEAAAKAKAEAEAIAAAEAEASGKGAHALSAQDYRVLQRIVQAEAGGCDMTGRILVANVVLNRVESKEFPDNVTDVVYQKSQFSPVSDGSLDRCTVSEATVEAVDRALAGEDYSQGALYFMNRSASYSRNVRWFDGKLTYLFQHGGHEFFR